MHNNVLIVDDDEFIRNSFVSILSNKFTVYTAENGEKALDIAKTIEIGVIIVDYDMPIMNGLELLCEMNKMTTLTRKIMLTGNSTTQIVIEAINLGRIDKFLTKPVDVEAIIAGVEEEFDEYQKQYTEKLRIKSITNIYNNQLKDVNTSLLDTLTQQESMIYERSALSKLYTKIIHNLSEVLEYLESDPHVLLTYVHQVTKILESLADEFPIAIFDFTTVFLGALESIISQRYFLLEKLNRAFKIMILVEESLINFSDIVDEFGKLDYTNKKAVIELYLKFCRIDVESVMLSDLYKRNKPPYPGIGYIMIIKEDIPIFTEEIGINFKEISLIANFFAGLNIFVSEVFHNSMINTLQLDNAVIITKKVNDIIYIIQADFETIELRMNFEIFIEQTIEYAKKMDPGLGIEDHDAYLLRKSNEIIHKSAKK